MKSACAVNNTLHQTNFPYMLFLHIFCVTDYF